MFNLFKKPCEHEQAIKDQLHNCEAELVVSTLQSEGYKNDAIAKALNGIVNNQDRICINGVVLDRTNTGYSVVN